MELFLSSPDAVIAPGFDGFLMRMTYKDGDELQDWKNLRPPLHPVIIHLNSKETW